MPRSHPKFAEGCRLIQRGLGFAGPAPSRSTPYAIAVGSWSGPCRYRCGENTVAVRKVFRECRKSGATLSPASWDIRVSIGIAADARSRRGADTGVCSPRYRKDPRDLPILRMTGSGPHFER